MLNVSYNSSVKDPFQVEYGWMTNANFLMWFILPVYIGWQRLHYMSLVSSWEIILIKETAQKEHACFY